MTTTSESSQHGQSSLVFTDSAASKVYELIQEEDNQALNLRVFITGGGCSGFQYGFTFEETIKDDDTIVEKTVASAEQDQDPQPAVKLLVDPLSFQYLVGAEIDYKDDLDGQRFVIRNPNANTTCGCGASFSADDPNEKEE